MLHKLYVSFLSSDARYLRMCQVSYCFVQSIFSFDGIESHRVHWSFLSKRSVVATVIIRLRMFEQIETLWIHFGIAEMKQIFVCGLWIFMDLETIKRFRDRVESRFQLSFVNLMYCSCKRYLTHFKLNIVKLHIKDFQFKIEFFKEHYFPLSCYIKLVDIIIIR